MINITTSFNNLKTKVNDLADGQLKAINVDLKKNKWCSR